MGTRMGETRLGGCFLITQVVKAARMDWDRPRPGCDGPGRWSLWVRMGPPEGTGVLKEGRQTRAASLLSASPKWASYQNQTSPGLCILQDCVSAPSLLLLCLKYRPHRPTILSPWIYLCHERLLHRCTEPGWRHLAMSPNTPLPPPLFLFFPGGEAWWKSIGTGWEN